MSDKKLIERLKKASWAIYLATDEAVADSIAAILKEAIAALSGSKP